MPAGSALLGDPPDGAARARQIVEGLGDGFLSLDAEWRITDCNSALERFLNLPRLALVGRTIWNITGVTRTTPFAVLARRVATTREAEEAEITFARRGDNRLLSVRVFPVAGGVGAVWRDITEIRAAGLALAESEARYRELADGTPAAAWLTRKDGTLEFINQAMAEALDRPREALLGDGWLDTVDPDEKPLLLKARLAAWSAHTNFDYEGRFRRLDGGVRMIQLHGRPRFDRSGAFNGFVGLAADVTDVRAAERQQALLIDELNHRVRNTLATVRSIVRLTLRDGGSASELEERLTARLLTLSTAHDVLTREHWDSADLADIARAAVAPVVEANRITFVGPAVRLAPNVVVALTMALHELATNALRHGALASPAGQVRLTWTAGDDWVDLEWRESGGEAVSPPELSGFGTRLLRRGLAGELGQGAELIFAPTGLICRIRAAKAPRPGNPPGAGLH
jgi:PAS domain S-box-containing protein